MTNFKSILFVLLTILVVSKCTPTKLTYINFGNEKTASTNPTRIVHYGNRLNIKSEFIELGVIISEGLNEPDIEKVRLLASEKGADGIFEEGNNFVLIKIIPKNQQKIQKLDLINENHSPLHRIMSIFNIDMKQSRFFKNNICAFHIGNGFVVSVAHNLKSFNRLPPLLTNNYFQNELYAKIDTSDYLLFDEAYPNIPNLNYRLLTTSDLNIANELANKLDTAKVDRSYNNLYNYKCCKPYLVASFRNNVFCGDTSLSTHFNASNSFYESELKRHTFFLELELLDAFVNEDIAIYQIINTDSSIINRLPSIDIDFELYDTGLENIYCLQSGPYDNLGRILNEAHIEGILDNFKKRTDTLKKTYIMDGMRYLIKGYFRFGSSGAPYIVYDEENQVFKANAIQSQASYIEMAIKNDRKGNFQYINAIATPFSTIEEKLKKIIDKTH